MDITGLEDELRPIYSFGQKEPEPLEDLGWWTPELHGSPPEDVPFEHRAEMFRQYMAAPDEFRARAPRTAARIRAFVNSHPETSPTLQFNALASAAYLGADVLAPPPPAPNALAVSAY